MKELLQAQTNRSREQGHHKKANNFKSLDDAHNEKHIDLLSGVLEQTDTTIAEKSQESLLPMTCASKPLLRQNRLTEHD